MTEPHGTYTCPGYEGTVESPADPYNGYAMVQCRRCSLLHTFERDFAISQYEDVYTHQSACRGMIDAAQRTSSGEMGYRALWWFKRLGLRWLERHGKGRLLDVGCGPGTFLLVARQRGWEVTGLEPAVEPAHWRGPSASKSSTDWWKPSRGSHLYGSMPSPRSRSLSTYLGRLPCCARYANCWSRAGIC